MAGAFAIKTIKTLDNSYDFNVVNSIFAGNIARSYAGALVYIGDKGSFINSTFTNNTAPNGGGALLYVGNDMGSFNCYFMQI